MINQYQSICFNISNIEKLIIIFSSGLFNLTVQFKWLSPTKHHLFKICPFGVYMHLRLRIWRKLVLLNSNHNIFLDSDGYILNCNLWQMWWFHLSNRQLPDCILWIVKLSFISSNISSIPFNVVNKFHLIRNTLDSLLSRTSTKISKQKTVIDPQYFTAEKWQTINSASYEYENKSYSSNFLPIWVNHWFQYEW